MYLFFGVRLSSSVTTLLSTRSSFSSQIWCFSLDLSLCILLLFLLFFLLFFGVSSHFFCHYSCFVLFGSFFILFVILVSAGWLFTDGPSMYHLLKFFISVSKLILIDVFSFLYSMSILQSSVPGSYVLPYPSP